MGFRYVLFSVWNFKSDFAGCFNTSFYNFTWVLLICYDCFWLTYYSSSDLSIFVGLKKRVCFLHTRFWVVWIKMEQTLSNLLVCYNVKIYLHGYISMVVNIDPSFVVLFVYKGIQRLYSWRFIYFELRKTSQSSKNRHQFSMKYSFLLKLNLFSITKETFCLW